MTERPPESLPSSWANATISDVAAVNPRLNKGNLSDDLEVSFVPMPAVEELTGRGHEVPAGLKSHGEGEPGVGRHRSQDRSFRDIPEHELAPVADNREESTVGRERHMPGLRPALRRCRGNILTRWKSLVRIRRRP